MPVGFGIKKLQITCVIEDSKVESMDAIIEDDLVRWAFLVCSPHKACLWTAMMNPVCDILSAQCAECATGCWAPWSLLLHGCHVWALLLTRQAE